jgi:hypothetical protein
VRQLFRGGVAEGTVPGVKYVPPSSPRVWYASAPRTPCRQGGENTGWNSSSGDHHTPGIRAKISGIGPSAKKKSRGPFQTNWTGPQQKVLPEGSSLNERRLADLKPNGAVRQLSRGRAREGSGSPERKERSGPMTSASALTRISVWRRPGARLVVPGRGLHQGSAALGLSTCWLRLGGKQQPCSLAIFAKFAV